MVSLILIFIIDVIHNFSDHIEIVNDYRDNIELAFEYAEDESKINYTLYILETARI